MIQPSIYIHRIHSVLAADTDEFSVLLRLSGLDPQTSFRGADLRHVNFGTADLSGFDLSHADVRGADFSRTTGIGQAVLDDIVFDTSTKGLPLNLLRSTNSSDMSYAYSKTDAQVRLISGSSVPRHWTPFITRLDLSFSDMSTLEHLSDLVYLQELDLTATLVSDLWPLSNLRSLQSLLLAETQILDLKPLSGLTGLKCLRISGTNVSDLQPIKNLLNLHSLDLSRTLVRDVSALSSLSNLRELYLGSSKIYDCSPLADIEQLQILDVTETLADVYEVRKLEVPITYTDSGVYKYSKPLEGNVRPGEIDDS